MGEKLANILSVARILKTRKHIDTLVKKTMEKNIAHIDLTMEPTTGDIK